MKNNEKKSYSALFAEIVRELDVITTSGFDGEDQFIKKSSLPVTEVNDAIFEL